MIAYCWISHSGAKNVINACQECKVKRLIDNSSADVVFDGSYDINNGDESLLYAWKVCLSFTVLHMFYRISLRIFPLPLRIILFPPGHVYLVKL
ncbi:unnamed protein product [Camellia sinensis]